MEVRQAKLIKTDGNTIIKPREPKTITPNSKQIECIKTLDGPVMVLAGPGTGKTFTIIQRIKYMLEEDILPETILCLTFSEAAANEMKIRLVKEVGTVASSVEISTYHAFCNNIISQFPVKFELMEKFNIIDDLTKYSLMREIVDEYKPKFLLARDYDPYYYVKPLTKAVDEIKLNRVNKDKYFEVLENGKNWGAKLQELLTDKAEQEELAKIGKRNHLKTTDKEIIKLEEYIDKAKEAWDIIKLSTKRMQDNNLIDFNDMINFVLNAFENDPEFARGIRSKYKYLLIDEYQDTNKSQNQLIFELASDNENANIMVVGDDDQIIYQFQGAQTDNLEKFLKTYSKTKVVCLEENNRSSQTILDLSRKILKQTPARLEDNKSFEKFDITKELTAKNLAVISQERKVELHSFADTVQEINYIVDKVQEVIKENPQLALNEIAILTRTNPELEIFSDIFKNKGIPFQTNKKKDIFSLKPSLLTYLYLKVLDNHQLYSAGLFGMLNHAPFSFDVNDFTYLVKNTKKVVKTDSGDKVEHRNFISVIKEDLDSREWSDREKIENFIQTFDVLKELQAKDNVYNLIIHVLNKTGILKYYADNPEYVFDNIASIKKLTDLARSFQVKNPSGNLSEFLNYLDTSLKQEIPLSIEDNDIVKNAVQLVTCHKSKGREFSYVFLYNLNSKKWEKSPARDNLKIPVEKASFSDDPAEEKDAETGRLLFVAMTRAKYALYLTHSIMVKGKSEELSKFISHIADNEKIIKKHIYELTPEELAQEYINQFTLPEIYICDNYLEGLRERAKRHVMSATSLNAYNACPRKFLYSHIYRIPVFEYISPALAFGTAVHESFEKFTKIAMEQKIYPDKEALVSYFINDLNEQLFATPEERSNFMLRGENVLTAYYDRFVSIPINNVISAELDLRNITVGDYMVKGKIDRIEKTENGYTVVDFKTGKTRSKKSIEEGNKIDYMDQLRFYKLLYETQYPDRKVHIASLIFVEEPRTLDFELIQDDVEIIKDKIFTAFKSIHKLEFDACDQPKQQADGCKFCNYKLLCKLNTV